MVNITGMKYLGNYELELKFNSGLNLAVDLSEELSGEIFEPLKDIAWFKEVYLNLETGTIEWPNGADFAPEFLLELALEQQRLHVA